MLRRSSRSINSEMTEADLVQAVLGQAPMTDAHFRAARDQTRRRLERVRTRMVAAKRAVVPMLYSAHSA